jgi:hypothetical protein
VKPQRLAGLVLIVVGFVLLVMGVRATDSFSSQVSEFFTGSFSDRAIWLLLGGVAAIVLGGGLSARR